MRDELPNKKHLVECGIMNFNKSNEIRSHWIFFVPSHKVRIYFDSLGPITQIELQKYLARS